MTSYLFFFFFFGKKLSHSERTRVCDPRYSNSSVRISEISTKVYAQKIRRNITDVSPRFPEVMYDLAVLSRTTLTLLNTITQNMVLALTMALLVNSEKRLSWTNPDVYNISL